MFIQLVFALAATALSRTAEPPLNESKPIEAPLVRYSVRVTKCKLLVGEPLFVHIEVTNLTEEPRRFIRNLGLIAGFVSYEWSEDGITYQTMQSLLHVDCSRTTVSIAPHATYVYDTQLKYSPSGESKPLLDKAGSYFLRVRMGETPPIAIEVAEPESLDDQEALKLVREHVRLEVHEPATTIARLEHIAESKSVYAPYAAAALANSENVEIPPITNPTRENLARVYGPLCQWQLKYAEQADIDGYPCQADALESKLRIYRTLDDAAAVARTRARILERVPHSAAAQRVRQEGEPPKPAEPKPAEPAREPKRPKQYCSRNS